MKPPKRAPLDRSRHRSLAFLLLAVTIWLVLPAQALARTVLRFIHAVPAAGPATLELGSGSSASKVGTIAFGQSSTFHSVRTGQFVWTLRGSDGKTLATGASTIGEGTYTGVFLANGKGVSLGLYKDQPGVPGKSLIRVIHAAPELGSPSLKFDGKVVDPRLDFKAATPFLTVAPGSHTFAAMAAGSPAPVLSGSVKLAADVAYSAVVVGSQGQPVRVVTVTDRGAPLTHAAAPAKGHAAAQKPHGASKAAGHHSASRPGTSAGASTAGWTTVRRGDSLWAIARRHLGHQPTDAQVAALVQRIWDSNSGRIGTGDPNLIFPGQHLRIP